MRKITALALFFLFCLSGAVRADTIFLKNGKKVKGDVYEDMGYAVKIETKGSLKTYFQREIEKIEYDDPQKKVPLSAKPQEARDLDKIEESKKELIRRLLVANGARDNMMAIFTQMMATLSPQDQARVKDVIVPDKLIEAVIPVYDRHFSEGELREMIKFYSSPTGQKAVEKMPAVVDEAMKAALEHFKQELGGGQ